MGTNSKPKKGPSSTLIAQSLIAAPIKSTRPSKTLQHTRHMASSDGPKSQRSPTGIGGPTAKQRVASTERNGTSAIQHSTMFLKTTQISHIQNNQVGESGASLIVRSLFLPPLEMRRPIFFCCLGANNKRNPSLYVVKRQRLD